MLHTWMQGTIIVQEVEAEEETHEEETMMTLMKNERNHDGLMKETMMEKETHDGELMMETLKRTFTLH